MGHSLLSRVCQRLDFMRASVGHFILLRFVQRKGSIVSIYILKIRTLVDGISTRGRYAITWNGTDDFGQPVSSGMYFYRMKSSDFQSVKKLMLLK